MGRIETKLAELGVTLPDAPAPAANYVPYVQVGDMLHVSGQIAKDASGLIAGKLGRDMDTAAGAAAARVCAISLLAQVINGASDFLGEALGDAGQHARSAVSAASLPFGVAVEIDGIFQIR